MVWGLVAGVGPGIEQSLNSKEWRAASKSGRTIAESQEKRDQDEHEWLKGLGDRIGNRGAVDNLEEWMRRYSGGLYQGQGSITNQPYQPPMQGALPQPQQQFATVPASPTAPGVMQAPAPAPAPGVMQGAATGGPVEVPEEQMGPPVEPQQTQQMGPPVDPQQQNIPSRRERYNQWYNDTAKYALLNGGLDGYQKFQEMENAMSRRQTLGYALQAVDALDKGQIAEAMRAGNSALEVTPFDTGLKFEARNGQLHMVGPDGNPGPALNADHLRGFVDDHMKTPENYLDWKKQYETERSNVANEGLRGREADISAENAITGRINSATAAKQAETYWQRFELDKKFRDREMQVKEANALANLTTAKAANRRAMQAIERGLGAGWDPSHMLRLMSDAQDWTIESMEYLDPSIKEHMQDDPNAFNHLVEDTQFMMLENPAGSVVRETAARVSQYLRQPGGFDYTTLGEGESFAIERGKQSGRLYAVVNGRKVLLTPELEQLVFNDPRLSNMVEGGGKEQKTPLSTPATQQPSYTYQDIPEGELGPPALPDAGPEKGPPLSSEQLARMRTPRAI